MFIPFYKKFDRDEPAREKEAYITVRASDNGQPTLDDVCNFKVLIEDINDNPPVFDKVVRFLLNTYILSALCVYNS